MTLSNQTSRCICMCIRMYCTCMQQAIMRGLTKMIKYTGCNEQSKRYKISQTRIGSAQKMHFQHNFLLMHFCGRVPWLYQYWPGGFMLFVVLCPGTPEGSTGSGSGFKASQKTGQRLKVSSDRLGEAGNHRKINDERRNVLFLTLFNYKRYFNFSVI